MFSKRLKGLVPYTAGEQPQDRSYLKLNTNENPYPPSPLVQEVFDHYAASDLRLYPDPSCEKLRDIAARELGLTPANIFVGNGSDEVLSFVFFSFFDSAEGPVLFPEYTYSFFPVYCNFYGIDFKRVSLEADYSFDPGRFLDERRFCGLIFPNPNAPTGCAISRSQIEALLDKVPDDRVVVVDEAYIDYGGESVVSLCAERPNLLVVHTFSKSRSLAGMRLGFAYGARELIAALNSAKDSFNSYPVDRVAQAVGIAALSDEGYYRSINRRIVETRESFTRSLAGVGWRVLPSRANFVFASHPSLPGKEVYVGLKERGILVRHFAVPGIDQFVRITIGRPEDMERFLEVVATLPAAAATGFIRST